MTGRAGVVLILQLTLDLPKFAPEPHVLPSSAHPVCMDRAGVNTYGPQSTEGGNPHDATKLSPAFPLSFSGKGWCVTQWLGHVSQTALDLASDPSVYQS